MLSYVPCIEHGYAHFDLHFQGTASVAFSYYLIYLIEYTRDVLSRSEKSKEQKQTNK